jgi:phage terminase Nu1 subunit (DNA packaging protein)
MTQTPQNLITRKQAASRAGVDPRTVDNWRRAGLLTTYTKRGSRTLVWIDADQLDSLTRPQPVVPAQRTEISA